MALLRRLAEVAADGGPRKQAALDEERAEEVERGAFEMERVEAEGGVECGRPRCGRGSFIPGRPRAPCGGGLSEY